MGLEQGGQKRTFLSVAQGKIVQSYGVTADTKGAIARTKDNGDIVHELHYPAVSGFVKSVYTKEQEFNGSRVKKWVVVLTDNGEDFQIEMPMSSRYAKSLLRALPNVDFSKPVRLSPWMKVIDGKPKLAMYVNQGEGTESVKWFFTREEPNGLPEMQQVKFKGELVWDDSEQTDFLVKYVSEVLEPRINEAQAALGGSPAVAQQDSGQDEAIIGDDESDLPF